MSETTIERGDPRTSETASAHVAAIRAAAKAASSWTGWEWAHDPGGHGIVLDGPGAVGDWGAWQRERRAELDVTDLDLTPDDRESLSDDDIAETLDAVACLEREYGEACQDDAEAAAELAEQCIEAAEAGDYDTALEHATAASRLESVYGDDPEYRGLRAACEAALAELALDDDAGA